LAAGTVVARDDARHRLLRLHRSRDAHDGLAARAEPPASGRVVDLDPARADCLGGRRLAHPRLAQEVAAKPPEEDLAEGEDDAETGELDVAGPAVLDSPRQRALADPVGRAAARPAADRPARADRIAVARL